MAEPLALKDAPRSQNSVSKSEDEKTVLRQSHPSDDFNTSDDSGDAGVLFNDPLPVDVEFANEKLLRIEGHFQKLAPIMAKLTLLLLAKDRHAFSELECQAKEQMLKIDAALISFEAKVKSEYVSMPLSWKLVLWFLSFLSARAENPQHQSSCVPAEGSSFVRR